jgi:UDP-N-acetylmuramate dehydrogenase
MIALEDLKQAVRGEVLLSETLAKYSSFKIGGAADFFIKPADKADALRAIEFFDNHRTPHLVLGRGSNVLIADDGVRGAVISLRENLERVEVTERGGAVCVYAEAGVDLPALASQMLKQGYGGLENLSGVPGSLGGAILMNAGAYGKEIFEVIEWVEVIRGGKIITLKKSEISARYRATDLTNDVILSCEMKLKKLSPNDLAQAQENRKRWMEKRRATQPLNLPNAGSIFKNPPPDAEGNPQFAGALIEACGLKGVRHGGAMISDKHANFIVNVDNAKAADVMALIDLSKSAVKKKFNIELELEVKLIGFESVKHNSVKTA